MKHPPYRLHDSLGYQFSVTARVLERGFEDALKKLGLSRITWCILLAVDVEGLQMPSDIADFIGTDRTATSRALRQMEKSGLIVRMTGSEDKRTTHVTLTEKALTAMEAATEHARNNAARFQNKLTKAEYNTLMQLLAKLRADEGAGLSHL